MRRCTRRIYPHDRHGCELRTHCGQTHRGLCMPGRFCRRRSASLSSRRRFRSRRRKDLAVLLLRRLLVEESESDSPLSLVSLSLRFPLSSSGTRTVDRALVGT